MKIYYTTSDILDEELEQNCPFGERHHFELENGEVYNNIKKVGCGGCQTCKYCYGGYHKPYKYIVIPTYHNPDNTKQYTMIPQRYVKCARCYNDSARNKFSMRFKLWYYHKIVLPVNNLYFDAKFNIRLKWNTLIYKIKQL